MEITASAQKPNPIDIFRWMSKPYRYGGPTAAGTFEIVQVPGVRIF
jgi:hypothetical protein